MIPQSRLDQSDEELWPRGREETLTLTEGPLLVSISTTLRWPWRGSTQCQSISEYKERGPSLAGRSYVVCSYSCYNVTLLQLLRCYIVTFLRCYNVMLLQLLCCYIITLLHSYIVTLLYSYVVTLLRCYINTFLCCYVVTLLRCYVATLLHLHSNVTIQSALRSVGIHPRWLRCYVFYVMF